MKRKNKYARRPCFSFFFMGNVVFIMVMLVSGFSCNGKENYADNRELQIYAPIAKQKLKELNIKASDKELFFDKENAQWKYQGHKPDKPPFHELEGKDYCTLIYVPQRTSTVMFGGTIWLFIERDSKEVLYVFREK